MKKSLLILATFTVISSGNILAAPGDSVPNTFSNNSIADADQVNANFSEVITQIQSLATSGVVGPQGPAGIQGPAGVQGLAGVDATAPPTASFRDFTHGYNSKTFVVKDTAGKYDTEIRTFDRSINGELTYTRDRLLGATRYRYHTYTLDNSGAELRVVEFKAHDTGTLAVTETRTITPGITQRTENMVRGAVFGSDSVVTSSINGESHALQTVTLIADNLTVTVPAGTFTGCIKLARHRSSTIMGGTYDRINTHCPNVGLVRQFHGINKGALGTDTWHKELSTCNGSANC